MNTINPHLVTRLRNAHDNADLCREAANEIQRLREARQDDRDLIDRLRQEVRTLRSKAIQKAALNQIADHFNTVDNRHAE